MKVKGVFMGLVCLLMACEKGIDYGRLKELLLKKAPSENEVFLIISKEKGEDYPVKSGEVLQSWLSPPLSEVESAIITNETPVIFWLSLIQVNVPPSPYEPYEPSPPPCPNGVICGDILYSFVYAEFPDGATSPQNINEGIIAFRYEWREGENPGTAENNYWQRISYRFIDKVPVSGRISGRVINAITGEPIERAKVYAEHSSGRNSMVAVTDANGDFSIILVRPGNNTLRAFADEFQIAEVENVVVQPNSTIDVGTIELLPIPDADAFGTIRGKVYFRDCQTPVYGVQIYGKFYKTIAYLTDSNGNQVFPSAATVYQDGGYQIGLIPPGNYQLRFRVQDLSGISRFGDQMFSPATSFVPITITQTNAEGFKITDIPDVCLDNLPPHLINLVPSKTVVSPNETITITANATDPDNDILYYYWSASDGFLGLGFSNSITWTAPSTPGTYKIKVVVNDHKGGWDSEELSIELKTWKGVGGSDTGGGIIGSDPVTTPIDLGKPPKEIVSDTLGNIYTVWQEGSWCGSDTKIHLKMWNRSTSEWINLGSSSEVMSGRCSPVIGIGSDNLPVVMGGYEVEGEGAKIKKWNGTEWTELPPSGAYATILNTPSLAVDENNFIYVSWSPHPLLPYQLFEVYLRMWNGNEWQEIDGSASGGGLSNAQKCASNPNVIVKNGRIAVVWESAEPMPEVFPCVYLPAIHEIFLKYWNGKAWIELGGSSSGGGVSNSPLFDSTHPDVAIGNDGNPIVVWEEMVSPPICDCRGKDSCGVIYLKKWNGSEWIELGNSASGCGLGDFAYSPSIILDENDNPVVAFSTNIRTPPEFHFVIYIKKWNGSEWVGIAGSSSGYGVSGENVFAISPSLTVDPFGIFWVEYKAYVLEGAGIYVKKDP
jgi:hypothetical protein